MFKFQALTLIEVNFKKVIIFVREKKWLWLKKNVSQKTVVEACNVAHFSKEYSTVCSLPQLYSSFPNTGWVAERIHFGRAEFEGTKWKRRECVGGGGERERERLTFSHREAFIKHSHLW